MGKKITLCEGCTQKLKEAASRGGLAGSHADKVKAGMASVQARREKALSTKQKQHQ